MEAITSVLEGPLCWCVRRGWRSCMACLMLPLHESIPVAIDTTRPWHD